MKTTMPILLLLAASSINATAQERKVEKPTGIPEIVVRPSHDPYSVSVVPGEHNEWRVREWIAYCHPHLSFAAGGGIRHYVYQQGTTGCEFGLTAQ
jgi:hypothetical protein